MSTLLWLLAYDVLLVTSVAATILSAKSMMKQFAGTEQRTTTVAKLLGTAICFMASCMMVLYLSGVMTIASTR